RAAFHAALHADRVSSSGARYAPGQVIVKFRDDAPLGSRQTAMASASPTAVMRTRPAYANFDIVTIDPIENAEAAARTLAARPEVEYAQPAYRVHTMFVPNDPYYGPNKETSGQWNLPLIGMEAAWDIQPQAGSTITVAVLDTGMAYMNATI